MFILVLGSGLMEAGGDISVPAMIADLSVTEIGVTSVTLSWTATGDNGSVGQATEYDVRYSTSGSITDENFSEATEVLDEPAPQKAGNTEVFEVTGLDNDQTYWFAVRTADEVPNWSFVSNSVQAVIPDQVEPDAVSDLTASNPGDTTVDLTWTTTGDDANVGTADHFLIRRSSATITEGNWAAATPVAGSIPDPLEAGTEQSMTVTGLALYTLYYFAMKVVDEDGNESALSNVDSATTLFNPTALPNCVLWLRADLGVTMDESDRVATWADQSGNGNNFTQTTDTKKPVWQASVAAFNNKPTLLFDSAKSQTLGSSFAQFNKPLSCGIVFQEQGTTLNRFVFANETTGNVAYQMGGCTFGSGVNRVSAIGAEAISNIQQALPENEAAWMIVRYPTTGTTASQVVSNHLRVTDDVGTVTGNGSWQIGRWAAIYWKGHIVEIILYSGALSDTEQTALEVYLAARYGLAAPA